MFTWENDVEWIMITEKDKKDPTFKQEHRVKSTVKKPTVGFLYSDFSGLEKL